MSKKGNIDKNLQKDAIDDIIKRQSVKKTLQRRQFSKWTAVFLLIALFITGGAWGVLSMIDYNNTKVYIKDGLDGLSLSETPDYATPTTNLTMKGPKSFNAVTYSNIAINKAMLEKWGNISTGDYIAYSFYLKNISTTKDCTYSLSLSMRKIYRDIDTALRFLIIKTQKDKVTYSVYAKAKADNVAEAICYDSDQLDTQKPISDSVLSAAWSIDGITNTTTPFMGIKKEGDEEKYYIDNILDLHLDAEEVVKYTFYVWVEGSDADCKDNILGGYCIFDINFTLLNYGMPNIPNEV